MPKKATKTKGTKQAKETVSPAKYAAGCTPKLCTFTIDVQVTVLGDKGRYNQASPKFQETMKELAEMALGNSSFVMVDKDNKDTACINFVLLAIRDITPKDGKPSEATHINMLTTLTRHEMRQAAMAAVSQHGDMAGMLAGLGSALPGLSLRNIVQGLRGGFGDVVPQAPAPQPAGLLKAGTRKSRK